MFLLDALLTGDQEVVGSTPAGLTKFLHEDLIMKYFLRSLSLPFTDSRRAVVSFWQKNVQILVKHLED